MRSIHLLHGHKCADGMIFAKEDSDEDSEDMTVGGVGRGKKKTLYPLSMKGGRAVLPSLDEEAFPLQDKKRILRAFLTSSYGMFPFGQSVTSVSLV